METDKLPAGTDTNGETTNNKPAVGNKSRTAYFGDALREDYATGTDRIVDFVKKLNKSYFIDNSFTSTNENMKAVAYMLDTKAWSNFKDTTGKASYVIGGPTIEMTLDSYSQKHNVQYKAKVNDKIGYQLSKDNGSTWKNDYVEMLDANDSLYIINNTTNASAMWFCSPAANGNNNVMNIGFNGNVTGSGYSVKSLGFRPLICLNSNVELQKTENGFSIK